MQAIILAAGVGNRIRDFHHLPKGFLCLGEIPIVQESIYKLLSNGVSDILIITGYESSCYEALAKDEPRVALSHNGSFDRTGNLYSLYCAKDWVKDDVLVLESDIIYESCALSAIIESPAKEAILVGGLTQSGDEVFVQAEDFLLSKMSKNKSLLIEPLILGEFVGITKLSLPGFRALVDRLSKNKDLLHNGHYDEDGLVDVASHQVVRCVLCSDLLWAEIDHKEHFNRAKMVYSSIRERE